MKLSSRFLAVVCLLPSAFRFLPSGFCLLLSAICLLALPGCNRSRENAAPLPGASLSRPRAGEMPPPGAEAQKHGPAADERRQIFAQIVEDTDSKQFNECAILEGAPYKYFLRSLINVSHDAIRKQTNEQLTFEKLLDQPGMYRGQVMTLARGVFLEVSQAQVPPEYGLPPGYTIVPAVFVDSARDVYAVRILCPPNSTLYEKLEKSILDDSLPVARLSGYFMKVYARKTADANEPPWRRPLLICPEPEFSQGVPARHVRPELEESHFDKYLPSKRIDAPGAEERMVVELTVTPANKAGAVRIDGKDFSGGDVKEAIDAAVKKFKARLPADDAPHPAAVVLISAGAPRKSLNEILTALKAAGVSRIAIKTEL